MLDWRLEFEEKEGDMCGRTASVFSNGSRHKFGSLLELERTVSVK